MNKSSVTGSSPSVSAPRATGETDLNSGSTIAEEAGEPAEARPPATRSTAAGVTLPTEGKGGETEWPAFLTWLHATPPTIRARDGSKASSSTSAASAEWPNRSALLTALYGSPGTGSTVPPWAAAFRLEAFVGFLNNFQEASDAEQLCMVDAVVSSTDPNNRMVCAFANDVLLAANKQPGQPGIAVIPGTGGEALIALARQLASEPASLTQAMPAAAPQDAPAAKVSKRIKSRPPASARNIDKLLDATRKECTELLQRSGHMTARAPGLAHFNALLEQLLGRSPYDWAACMADARLSAARPAAQARYFALELLKSLTDENGFGKVKNGTSHLALLAACLLGYDLDALWFGTALKGFRPPEVAFWRALSREV